MAHERQTDKTHVRDHSVARNLSNVQPARSAMPPAFNLTAETLKEGEWGMGPEVDAGGKARTAPPNDGGGNEQQQTTQSVTVPVPAGTPKAEALVLGVMKILKVSRAEAELAIREEGIHFENYHPEGVGKDDAGNILHRIRVKPKYGERTAHEPLQPGEIPSPEVQGYYKAFKSYVQEIETNVRDGDTDLSEHNLGVIYDSWAMGMGIHPMQGVGNALVNASGLGVLSFAEYESMKTQVTELVLFDRLRMQRELLTGNKTPANPDLVSYLLTLEAQTVHGLPKAVQNGTAQNNFLGVFQNWKTLRLQLLHYQQAILDKNPDTPIPDQLVDSLTNLAGYFQGLADAFPPDGKQLKGTGIEGNTTYTAFDVAQLRRLADLGDSRGPADNLNLLMQTVELGFAMMECLGASGPGKFDSVEEFHAASEEEKAERQRNLQTEGLANRGNQTLDLMAAHPEAQAVEAVFYPEQATNQMQTQGQQEAIPGQDMTFFVWYDKETGEWVLDDLTRIESKKENRVPGDPKGPVPAELFSALNTKLRFPKGALMYRVPGESTYRILHTEGKMEWYEWVRWAALAGVGLSLGMVSGGLTIPATVVMLSSSLGFATADLFEMLHKREVGVLETQDTVLHIAGIISSLSGGIGAFSKIAFGAGSLSKTCHFLEVTADGIGLAVFSLDAAQSLSEMAENGASETDFARALSLYIGLGLIQVVGMKGQVDEMTGRKPISDFNGRVDELGAEDEAVRKRLQHRADRLEDKKQKVAEAETKVEASKKGNATSPEGPRNGLGGVIAEIGIGGNFARQFELGARLHTIPSGIIFELLSKENARKLFRYIKGLANESGVIRYSAARAELAGAKIALTAEEVIAALEKAGYLVKYQVSSADMAVIQAIIDDINMKGYSAEEIAFVKRYRGVYANSELTNIELQWHHRNGNFLDDQTQRIKQKPRKKPDHSAKYLAPDQTTSDLSIPEGFRPEDNPYLNRLIEERNTRRSEYQQIKQSNAQKGEELQGGDKDLEHKAVARIGRKSEHIAEATLDYFVTRHVHIADAIAQTRREIRLAKNPEQKARLEQELSAWQRELRENDTDGFLVSNGYERVYPAPGAGSSGSGDVDRIYIKTEKSGRTQLVEVKGGESGLGSRKLVKVGKEDATKQNQTAQQGSGLYLIELLLVMRDSPDGAVRGAGKVIEDGLIRSNLDYSHFKLGFRPSGETKAPFLKQFDISEALNYVHLLR